ncbi:MAG: DNA polymerase IV [Chloroflexi bacterium]|nr:DNA polymerase IV [Chloroflexota bacterium]
MNAFPSPEHAAAEGQTAGAAPQTAFDWPRAILHLDMDAFFVSVHRLQHPEDAGIPLVVGGRPEGRGVVAAASYEAREYGIHSAMPMGRALRLCPELRIVGHDWPAIQAASQQVMRILAAHGPHEPMSVDEAYVDLTGVSDPPGRAAAIRAEVRARSGLPASVGLATSKLVAKVASDHDKPEGCTIVPPGTEAAFLAPLSVRAIWGIGPRGAERLAALDIHTCGDLAAAEPSVLIRHFGGQADGLRARAAGIDPRPVVTDRGPARSISAERTFARDLADAEALAEILAQLAVRVGADLRRRQLQAGTLSIKLRMSDFSTFTRQTSFPIAIQADDDIRRQALALFHEHWPPGSRLRLLGIGLSRLQPADAVQLSLAL